MIENFQKNKFLAVLCFRELNEILSNKYLFEIGWLHWKLSKKQLPDSIWNVHAIFYISVNFKIRLFWTLADLIYCILMARWHFDPKLWTRFVFSILELGIYPYLKSVTLFYEKANIWSLKNSYYNFLTFLVWKLTK